MSPSAGMVDRLRWGRSARKGVEVQVLFGAHHKAVIPPLRLSWSNWSNFGLYQFQPISPVLVCKSSFLIETLWLHQLITAHQFNHVDIVG